MIKKNRVVIIFLLLFVSLQIYAYPSYSDLFENKNILIFGGTGYLGKAIIVELLKYNPKKVVVFSRDEVKHFNLSKLFANNPKIQSIVGDIRDSERVEEATREIDIIFHAAALKRIDILETNPQESIKTNIIGSINIFNAAIQNNVQKVVFISSDKACSPVNTYGACKFISEKIFTNYDKNIIQTQFIVARYGNVLESTGSVIPIFKDRIQRGLTLTLTDSRMTRFIISKEQAVQLIFDALRYGLGGEIFSCKLPAMKITDLIEIFNNIYDQKVDIELIGLRPGEKLHEQLVNETEISRTYFYNNYFVILPTVPAPTYSNPIYISHGQKASEILRKEYSSDQEIISQKELFAILNNLALLS